MGRPHSAKYQGRPAETPVKPHHRAKSPEAQHSGMNSQRHCQDEWSFVPAASTQTGRARERAASSVEEWYRDVGAPEDAEVAAMLQEVRLRVEARARAWEQRGSEQEEQEQRSRRAGGPKSSQPGAKIMPGRGNWRQDASAERAAAERRFSIGTRRANLRRALHDLADHLDPPADSGLEDIESVCKQLTRSVQRPDWEHSLDLLSDLEAFVLNAQGANHAVNEAAYARVDAKLSELRASLQATKSMAESQSSAVTPSIGSTLMAQLSSDPDFQSLTPRETALVSAVSMLANQSAACGDVQNELQATQQRLDNLTHAWEQHAKVCERYFAGARQDFSRVLRLSENLTQTQAAHTRQLQDLKEQLGDMSKLADQAQRDTAARQKESDAALTQATDAIQNAYQVHGDFAQLVKDLWVADILPALSEVAADDESNHNPTTSPTYDPTNSLTQSPSGPDDAHPRVPPALGSPLPPPALSLEPDGPRRHSHLDTPRFSHESPQRRRDLPTTPLSLIAPLTRLHDASDDKDHCESSATIVPPPIAGSEGTTLTSYAPHLSRAAGPSGVTEPLGVPGKTEDAAPAPPSQQSTSPKEAPHGEEHGEGSPTAALGPSTSSHAQSPSPSASSGPVDESDNRGLETLRTRTLDIAERSGSPSPAESALDGRGGRHRPKPVTVEIAPDTPVPSPLGRPSVESEESPDYEARRRAFVADKNATTQTHRIA